MREKSQSKLSTSPEHINTYSYQNGAMGYSLGARTTLQRDKAHFQAHLCNRALPGLLSTGWWDGQRSPSPVPRKKQKKKRRFNSKGLHGTSLKLIGHQWGVNCIARKAQHDKKTDYHQLLRPIPPGSGKVSLRESYNVPLCRSPRKHLTWKSSNPWGSGEFSGHCFVHPGTAQGGNTQGLHSVSHSNAAERLHR